ncbi:PHD finger protein 12, partial [Stegodyphus mimosarum]
MCPNHAEHLVDQKMLTSVSLSERVKLWDKFSCPVSQDAVKLHFLNKVNKRNPPFRRKLKLPSRKNIVVPNAVSEHYSCPPLLLPRVTEPLVSNEGLSLMSFSAVCSTDEQNEWLASVVSFQTNVAKHVANCHSSLNSDSTVSLSLDSNNDMSSDSTMSANSSILNHSNNLRVVQNGPHFASASTNGEGESTNLEPSLKYEYYNSNSSCVLSSSSNNVNSSCKFPLVSKPNTVSASRTHKSSSKSTSCVSNQCSTPISVLQTKPSSSNLSSSFNVSTSPGVRGLSVKSSFQDKLHMSNCDASPQILTKLFNNLQANFEGSEDFEVNKLDEKLLHILAYQRLQQLIPKRKYVSTEEKLLGDSTADGISDVRGRAVVCPLLKQGLPVAMCYRSLHLGLGADMDVCFSNYGHCNYVSGKHASIFYDEVTKRYELLNYSCYGTTVDNVLYSSDLSEKKPSTPNSLSAAVRRLAKSTVRLADLPSPITPNNKPMMSARGKQHSKPCNCTVNSSSLVEGNGAGWEGTALLHHGSYIKCGCLQFVFSVTEYGFRIENVKEKDFLPNILKKAS